MAGSWRQFCCFDGRRLAGVRWNHGMGQAPRWLRLSRRGQSAGMPCSGGLGLAASPWRSVCPPARMILEALPCAPRPAQWMHRGTLFLMRRCIVPRHACVHLASPAGSGRTLAPYHGRSPRIDRA
ncbi:hypothetical protein V8C26DRAFT_110854 [Trichoderma gracile]